MIGMTRTMLLVESPLRRRSARRVFAMRMLPLVVAAMLIASATFADGAEADGASESNGTGAPRPIAVSTVGVPVRIEQYVIAGPEVEALPIEDRRTPVVVRILQVFPHGSDFRYDLEVTGMEPGSHDLRPFLKRKGGSTEPIAPEPLLLQIESRLPAGQILPTEVKQAPLPYVGGYRWVAASLVVLWAGLMVWAMSPRRRATLAGASMAEATASPAELLRPLVLEAMSGTITPARRAELERALLGYWRQRLGLESLDPAVALEKVREHEEAGVLVRQIEVWLHSPGGANEADVAVLLRPYSQAADPARTPPSSPSMQGA